MAWIANRDEEWTRRHVPGPLTACVSITDPGRAASLPDGFVDVLRLQFDDLTSDDDLYRGYRNGVVLCNQHDASQIAAFALKHRGKNLLVHCAAGISRSGAIVETLLRAFPEYEDRGGAAHGWPRSPNPLVAGLLRKALGLSPRPGGRERSPFVRIWPDPAARSFGDAVMRGEGGEWRPEPSH